MLVKVTVAMVMGLVVETREKVELGRLLSIWEVDFGVLPVDKEVIMAVEMEMDGTAPVEAAGHVDLRGEAVFKLVALDEVGLVVDVFELAYQEHTLESL